MIKLVLTLVVVTLGFLSVWIADERGWRYVVLVGFGIVVFVIGLLLATGDYQQETARHRVLEQTGKEFDRVQQLIDQHRSKLVGG